MAASATVVERFYTLSAAAGELIWHDWQDAYSVYQPCSGETHLFNDTAAWLLERLGHSPASLAVLAGEAGFPPGGQDEAALAGLGFALERLLDLGLVDSLDGVASSL